MANLLWPGLYVLPASSPGGALTSSIRLILAAPCARETRRLRQVHGLDVGRAISRRHAREIYRSFTWVPGVTLAIGGTDSDGEPDVGGRRTGKALPCDLSRYLRMTANLAACPDGNWPGWR
jgi:hypothetical protein